MLSLFPQFFAYREIVPFIFRLITGIISLDSGYPNLKKPKSPNFVIGLLEFLSGIALVAGFLTQIAAGVMILLTIFRLLRPAPEKNYKFMLLFLVILIALIFLGPGFLAFDLPL